MHAYASVNPHVGIDCYNNGHCDLVVIMSTNEILLVARMARNDSISHRYARTSEQLCYAQCQRCQGLRVRREMWRALVAVLYCVCCDHSCVI